MMNVSTTRSIEFILVGTAHMGEIMNFMNAQKVVNSSESMMCLMLEKRKSLQLFH